MASGGLGLWGVGGGGWYGFVEGILLDGNCIFDEWGEDLYARVHDGVGIIEFHEASIIQKELHYDSIYHEHVIYFSIIIFLRYFGVVYGALLTISDKQKIRTYGVLFTLLFIILVDLYVIPTYGLYGALFTLIAAHIILTIIYFYFAYKEYKTSFLNFNYVK